MASSGDLDLGLSWRWNMTKHPNGTYRLRGTQNCCNALGPAAEVTVRN